jgi:hypothetical protein
MLKLFLGVSNNAGGVPCHIVMLLEIIKKNISQDENDAPY